MKRISIQPRKNWESIVEGMGFNYHSKYWNEKAYYKFTIGQIENIEHAINELEYICMEAVQHIIDENLFEQLAIPNIARQRIIDSWNNDELSLYGRFDLAYSGQGDVKLIEYNADTPTSLFEASVIQWQWLQDKFPKNDQFNGIHEKLIATWKSRNYKKNIHFAFLSDNPEDVANCLYMADTAYQAGYIVNSLDIEDIGSDGNKFFGENELEIDTLFKLYPWEMIWGDKFGEVINKCSTLFIEPPWKLLLSNKGILALLWKMFPEHKNLLPAYTENNLPSGLQGKFVKKPFFSREGANVSLGNFKNDNFIVEKENQGDYGAPFVFQEYFELPIFEDEISPILGGWVVDGTAIGIGVREDKGITGNMSNFVPHLIGD